MRVGRSQTGHGVDVPAPLTLSEREARLVRHGAHVAVGSTPSSEAAGAICTVTFLDGRVFTGRGSDLDAARAEALAQAEDALGLLAPQTPDAADVPTAVRVRRAAPWVAACLAAAVGALFAYGHIPSAPGPGPDLDCADIGHQVRVGASDPHGLDRDRDGIGCEADGRPLSLLALGLVAVAGGAGVGAIRGYTRTGP